MAVDWASFALQSNNLNTGNGPPCPASDYSPLSEDFSYPDVFNEAYLKDAYTTQGDCSFDDFVIPDFYDRPIASIETTKSALTSPAGFGLRSEPPFLSNMPAITSWQQSPLSTSLPELEKSIQAQPTSAVAPGSTTSSYRSSNDYNNASHLDKSIQHASQDILCKSPTVKRSSSEASEAEPVPKRVAKKRGRPRLNRPDAETSSDGSPDAGLKPRVSRRLPHNQVERKYREGLNSEMERLRRAVPTLPQRDSTDLNGPPKPSKATVLASAIEYIKYMEIERERLLEENERLRGMRPEFSARLNSTARGYAWGKSRESSASSASFDN